MDKLLFVMKNKIIIILLLSIFFVNGCGFQLRSQYKLPYQLIEVNGEYKYNETVNLLKRYVHDNNQINDKNSYKDTIQIDILKEDIDKKILSLNVAGKVREYAYYYVLSYEIKRKGNPLGIQDNIVIRRDLSYSDKDVLSKESEENLMYKDMRRDAVQQLIRKLTIMQLPS